MGLSFSKERGTGLPSFRNAVSSRKGMRYIPFTGDGMFQEGDNLYPQTLARLALEAPTHSAAIAQKQMVAKGQGIDYTLLSPEAQQVMQNINSDYESLNDVHDLVCNDYMLYEGFAIKVRYLNDGTIGELCHIPFEQVRVGEPDEHGKITTYCISNNWRQTLAPRLEYNYTIPAFNPEVWNGGATVTNDGVQYTDEQLDNAEQLIYVWNKRPAASDGMLYYPVPPYIGAIDHIMTEIQIGISNKALLENGFGGKYLVTFPFIPTREERELNDVNMRLNFQGANNNGNVIPLYVADEKGMPKVDKLEPLDADTYDNLEKSVKQNIITAHNIPAILLEYNYGGGFNNRAEEMLVAYRQFQTKYIKSYQNKICSVYRTIFKYMGYPNENFEVIPFDMSTETESANTGI